MIMPTTPEEAIALGKSPEWAKASALEKARIQIDCPYLIHLPAGRGLLSYFSELFGQALGRPVFTHEIALNHEGIRRELFGDDTAAPSPQEIIEMIPEDKRIVVQL